MCQKRQDILWMCINLTQLILLYQELRVVLEDTVSMTVKGTASEMTLYYSGIDWSCVPDLHPSRCLTINRAAEKYRVHQDRTSF